MSDRALKPCPCCGRETECLHEPHFGVHWIYCSGCGAAGGYRAAKAEAIQAWNTRAERTCKYTPMWNDDDLITGEYVGMWCTDCGDALVWNADNDGCCEPPAYCPYCGGKVVR